jgi:hypothetical protein
MLHEFVSLREGEFGEDAPDDLLTIDMNRVESAYSGSVGRSTGNTCIVMYSNDCYTLRIPYEEFVDIWKTCVDPININQ